MAKIPTTSTTLLSNIAQDAQNVRWGEFVARYRPMMEAFMRERFPSLESDDIIQETLVALCRVLPSYRYAPDEKGHFRNYLTGILRNKALRALRQRERDEALRADYADMGGRASTRADMGGRASTRAAAGAVALVATDSLADEEAERQYRESIFEIALRQFLADDSIADRTKRIFERTAINGESPEAVAESFKMTRHAVDQAKSRALERLRKLVKALEDVAEL